MHGILVPLFPALGPVIRFVVSSLIKPYETHRVGTSALPGKTYRTRVSGDVAALRSAPCKAPLPPRPTFIA